MDCFCCYCKDKREKSQKADKEVMDFCESHRVRSILSSTFGLIELGLERRGIYSQPCWNDRPLLCRE